MKRPFFLAGLVMFVTGLICLSGGFPAAQIAFVLLFGTDVVFCFLRKKKPVPYLIVISAAFTLAALSFYGAYALRVEPAETLCGTRAVSVTGTLTASPVETDSGFRMTLRRCKVNGFDVKVPVDILTDEAPDAGPGDEAEFGSVRFHKAPSKSIYYYHTLSSRSLLTGDAAQCVRVGKRQSFSLGAAVVNLRESAQKELRAHMTPQNAPIAEALLLGSREQTGDDLQTALRTAGASHIFAVSGMHLTLWTGVLFALLRKRALAKRWANAGAAAFVVFYMALTGFSPSVVRAAIMLITVFCGRMLRKRADALDSLGLAAVLQLTFSPFLAGNISFLLSFFAVAAILLVFPLFERKPRGARDAAARLKKSGAALLNAVLLSGSVLLFTVPVSAVFFGTVSLASPVSSVLCALPAEGVMLSSAAGLLTSPLRPLSKACFFLCEKSANALLWAVNAAASADFLYVTVNAPYVAVWYALVAAGAAVFFFVKRLRRWLAPFLLGMTGVVLLIGGAGRLSQTHSVRLLLPDNGNCTALCLQFEGAGAYMIGTGETKTQTRAAVQAFTDAGIAKADGLIVPDARPQECGQLPLIASQYRFTQVFTAEAAKKFFPAVKQYLNASDFTLGLPEGYVYTNYGNARAAVLAGASKTVFFFSPSADPAASPELSDGDALICRGGVPAGIDPARFDRIFVLSDKSAKALGLPPNAVTTGDEGTLTVPLKSAKTQKTLVTDPSV